MLLIKQRGNLLVMIPAVTCLRDSLIQNFLFYDYLMETKEILVYPEHGFCLEEG